MPHKAYLGLADLETLASPPPVLRSEDRELYEKIRTLRGLLCTKGCPGVASGESPHRGGLVYQALYPPPDRGCGTLVPAVTRISGTASEGAKRKKGDFANSLAERMTQRPPEVADLLHLEGKVLESPTELDEILQRTPTELQHNRALEKSMLFQEQLDKLIASATKRFNDALELFEHYREGLGQRLRRVAEDILKVDGPEHDGDGSPQTEGPSIVPSAATDTVTEEVNQFLASAKENK
jgi:hypothetical protein